MWGGGEGGGKNMILSYLGMSPILDSMCAFSSHMSHAAITMSIYRAKIRNLSWCNRISLDKTHTEYLATET